MKNLNLQLQGFSNFRLAVNRSVLCHSHTINLLRKKSHELLSVLAENGGEVISKDEIWQSAWQNSFVEVTNLTHNIYLLRKIFKDLGESDLIQTTPRRGYRFAGEIREVERSNGENVIEHHAIL